MTTEMYTDRELIQALSMAFGPSGNEKEVRTLIRAQIGAACDGKTTDKAGNLIFKLKGRGLNYDAENPRRMLVAAHMDEVGFMVRELTEDGYVRFSTIGQMDPRVLCGRHVCFHNQDDHVVPGVIATKAIHMQTAEERTRATPVQKMYVDIGAEHQESAQRLLEVGDWGTFASEFVSFGKDGRYMKGKALDNRCGCAALIETIRALHASDCDLAYDVYFAFTCHQEIGISAASVAAFNIDPDVALLVEATAVDDLPDVSPARRVAALGEGCVLSLADKGALYDAGLVRFAMRCAEEGGIAYQIKQGAAEATDGGVIQRSLAGVRMASLSLPVRYTHSAANVAMYEDYQALCQLCLAFISRHEL